MDYGEFELFIVPMLIENLENELFKRKLIVYTDLTNFTSYAIFQNGSVAQECIGKTAI